MHENRHDRRTRAGTSRAAGTLAALLLAALLVAGASSPSHAASVASTREAKRLTASVLDKVVAGDFEGGLRLLEPYVVVTKAEFDALLKQVSERMPAFEQLGASLGSELIDDGRLGDSVYRIRYLQKFERHALSWTFIFYRPEAGWVLNEFWFDIRLQNLFTD